MISANHQQAPPHAENSKIYPSHRQLDKDVTEHSTVSYTLSHNNHTSTSVHHAHFSDAGYDQHVEQTRCCKIYTGT